MTPSEEHLDEDEKAVTQLTELLNNIEQRVTSNAKIAALDERNRLTLLFGHAIFAMLVVPGFALLSKTGMKSPSFVVIRDFPGAPFSLAAWIGVAGFVLAVATLHRNHRWEFYSLIALGVWYALFSVSLMVAVAVWMAPAVEAGGLSGFTHHLDWSRAPSVYAPVVYAHLAYAMGGHVRTIWKLGLNRDRSGGP